LKIALSAPVDIRALARFLGQDTHDIAPGMGNTVTTPLIIELLRRGHEVTIYTLSNDLPEEAIYDWGSLRVFVGPNRRLRYFYRPQIAYLKRVIRADAPRFVHAHWTYEFALGALASGVPTLTTIHDLPWNVLRYFLHIGVVVRLLMAYMVAFKGTDFTAVSPHAARHFRHWLRPGAQIAIVPNFTADWIFDLGRTGDSRTDRPFTFVTVLQGWFRLKNGKCALRAFQLARESLPDARLLMIGLGYETGGVAHRWATSQGLAQGVTFRGPMQYGALLRFVMQEADVLVHPSVEESFSLAALEAMALKKPVIAGKRTPGTHWVLDEGRVGLLVDVREPKEVARAMQRLAGDPGLRRKLADAAFEHAWNNFRADVVVPLYEALYKRFDALAGDKSDEPSHEAQRT
jgi:glycosyltransferase involved in cell wall biosynthesis